MSRVVSQAEDISLAKIIGRLGTRDRSVGMCVGVGPSPISASFQKKKGVYNIVGGLRYADDCTRLYIAYVVGVVCGY